MNVSRICVLLLFLVLSAQASADDWQVHSSLPFPVTNNAVTTHVLNDTTFVYTFLGIDSTKVFSGITDFAARLNTVTDTWEVLPSVPVAQARIAASAVTLGDSLYVIGGYKVTSTGQEITTRRMMIFDPATKAWVNDGPDVPVRVDDMVAGVWNDSHIYLISGWSTNRNVTNVQVYDRATNTWAQATPLPGIGTFGGIGGVCGDHIVYMDGAADTSFSFNAVNNVVVGTINPLDPTQIAWEDRGTHPGPALYRAASWNLPGDDTRILICGGTDNPYNFNGQGYDGNPSEPLGTVWSYHVATGTSVFHADKLVATMDHRGFPSSGARLYVIGGMEGNQAVTTRVSSWLPDAVTGVTLPTSAASDLVLHAAPNPATTTVRFFAARANVVMENGRIHDAAGRVVFRFGTDALEAADGFSWDLRNETGSRVAPGVYWLAGQVDGRRVARSVTVLTP